MKYQSNRARRQARRAHENTPADEGIRAARADARKLTAYNAKGQAVTVTVPENDIPDELNPAYVFSMTATALLMRIASGELNAQAAALDMLANRGLDPATGKWVGFDAARALADAAKDQAGIL